MPDGRQPLPACHARMQVDGLVVCEGVHGSSTQRIAAAPGAATAAAEHQPARRRRRAAMHALDGLDPAAGSSSAQPPVDLPYVDPSKPVVFEVGKLGRRYWDWINHPESGKPRFFGNPIVESCTKVKWWVVPLLWLPFFTTVLCYSQLTHDIGAGASLACLLLGLLTWQGFEYSMHRFFFHAHTTSYVGLTLHFLFHGCHHKWPMDGDRLVFPPVPASWFIGASYVAISAVLPPRYALPMFAGMGYGYVAYDCLHYAIHHSKRDGFMRRLPLAHDLVAHLRARHLHHHYRDPTTGYGISSTLFDVLLGTSVASQIGGK